MRADIKGRFFTTREIWFEQFKSIEDIKKASYGVDVISIHANNCEINDKWMKCNIQHSLITDLTKNEEELWSGMTKTIRNEINRSERENVKVTFYTSDYLLEDNTIFNKFAEVYHNMYSEKGMEGIALGVNGLIGYAKNNQLIVSVAEIDNVAVVFHSYVHGDGNCRLLQSCSEFRIADNNMRNATGRANKFLHWNDIKYFKQRKYKMYDWGGVMSFTNPNGIDKFKMSFGNEKITYYNIEYALSFRKRMIDCIRSNFGRC